jgi:hypothetical protein
VNSDEKVVQILLNIATHCKRRHGMVTREEHVNLMTKVVAMATTGGLILYL